MSSSSIQKYNKPDSISKVDHGNFLKANCRIFLINDTAATEIDIKSKQCLLNWSSVQSIDIICPYDTIPCCTICLDEEFVAPHITRCGHVFCLTCFFQYLNSDLVTKSQSKKCPVCSMPIMKEELKLARFQLVEPSKNAQFMSFCLVEREYDSSLISLSKDFRSVITQHFPHLNLSKYFPNEEDIGIQFSRFATLKRPNLLWEQDIQSLFTIYDDYEKVDNQVELKAIRQAIEFITHRINLFQKTQSISQSCESQKIQNKVYSSRNIVDYNLDEFLHIAKSFLEFWNSDLKNPKSKFLFDDDDDFSTSKKDIKKLNSKIYTSYQVIDGQLCFLNPFQLSCLEYEYKNSKKMPPLLLDLKIIDSNTHFVNEKIIKKHNFLKYLPILTPITFVEAEIDHLLSEKTKLHFKETFERRLRFKNNKMQKSILEDKNYHEQIEIKKKKSETMNTRSNQYDIIKLEDHISFPSLSGGLNFDEVSSNTDMLTSSEFQELHVSLNSPSYQKDEFHNQTSPSYLDILVHRNVLNISDEAECNQASTIISNNTPSTLNTDSTVFENDIPEWALSTISNYPQTHDISKDRISINIEEEYTNNNSINELPSLKESLNYKMKTRNKKKY